MASEDAARPRTWRRRFLHRGLLHRGLVHHGLLDHGLVDHGTRHRGTPRSRGRNRPAEALGQAFGQAFGQAQALDHAVYRAIADVPTPALDRALRALSASANYSRLWIAVAGGLALTGQAGRRAAGRGLLAIGLTSVTINAGVKSLARRRRPDRAVAGVPERRHVPMPDSASFPSGHSASAFAFATAAARECPALAVPLGLLATAVAYSRVHTGVHYPGDAIAGALIGSALGQATAALADRGAGGPRCWRIARRGGTAVTRGRPGARSAACAPLDR